MISEHYRVDNEENRGPLKGFTHTGLCRAPENGPFAQIWLKIADGRIAAAGFDAERRPWSTICAGMCADMANGRTVEQASCIETEHLDYFLIGVPRNTRGSANRAITALKRALGVSSAPPILDFQPNNLPMQGPFEGATVTGASWNEANTRFVQLFLRIEDDVIVRAQYSTDGSCWSNAYSDACCQFVSENTVAAAKCIIPLQLVNALPQVSEGEKNGAWTAIGALRAAVRGLDYLDSDANLFRKVDEWQRDLMRKWSK